MDGDNEVLDTGQPEGGAPEGGAASEGSGGDQPVSLRDAIESAADAAEEQQGQPEGDAAPQGGTPAAAQPQGEQKPPAEGAPKPGEKAPQAPVADEAPKSWKAANRAKWAGLDPDVKQEVLRRDREVVRVLGESAQARQMLNTFVEAVRPYEARMRALGANPIETVQRFFHADYMLSSSTPAKAAEFMAGLIKEYGIDVEALDSALAGEVSSRDPVAERVEQMLQQRMAPLNTFLQRQQQIQQQEDGFRAQQASSEIEAMAGDPKYPHFEAVRNTMADIIDFYSARGQFFPLDQVYQRAVMMDPATSAQAIADQASQQHLTSAQRQHARAQRAQAASLSVTGSRAGAAAPTLNGAGGDLRSSVEAAWNAHAGR